MRQFGGACLIIDLISPSNMITYNMKVANLLGLHTAIYLSEVISIVEKASRKDLVDNGFVVISREYITSRTTLSSREQKDIDLKLEEIKILEIDSDNSDRIKLDIDSLAQLISGDVKKTYLSKIETIVKRKTKEEKQAEKLDSMKRNAMNAVSTENEELRAAYSDWIDAVLQRYGYITKAAVTENERLVDSFANHDLDVALSVIRATSLTGYNTMRYAIDQYQSTHPTVSFDKKEKGVSVNTTECF